MPARSGLYKMLYTLKLKAEPLIVNIGDSGSATDTLCCEQKGKGRAVAIVSSWFYSKTADTYNYLSGVN